uniref:Uncharacterized protein n=1 Tax=Thermofilum pendens TaxID=2269 RepID=A0A7J3X6S8_THEPE
MSSLRSAPLSIKSAEEYRRYVGTFGKLPTKTFNDIIGYIESEERGLYFLLMPPGSGKTFLLYQLMEEYRRRGPVLLHSFSSSVERFQHFAGVLDRELAHSVAAWIREVTGKNIHLDNPEILLIAGAVATATGTSIPLLLLLDEVPLSEENPERFKALVSSFESLLRCIDNLGGFKVHIVITSHAVSADLSERFFDEVRARGGLQRFSAVQPFTKMELAPGFEAEAAEFVRKLAGGVLLDPLILRTAVEMLKRGFVFRQLVTFVDGARRKARSVDLERDLHMAIVNGMKSKLKERGVREGRIDILSRPDLVLADGTCIEVKVRAGTPEVNPVQHAECSKRIYVLVSPEPVSVPGAQVVHVKADVEQVVSALNTLRSREGERAYKGALAILAEAIATTVLEKMVPQPQPQAELLDQRVRSLCSKLSKLFGETPVLSRTDTVRNAFFKEILREVARAAPEELKVELERCLDKPKAGCVDTLAKATEKIYGRTALKVEGSKVMLGPLCPGGRR